MPDNQTIELAKTQNFQAFYKEEIETRKMFGFPPHCRMVKLNFAGTDQIKTEKMAQKIRQQLAGQLSSEYELHPVMQAGYAKVKDKYRYQFFIRGPSAYPVSQAIKNSFHFQKDPKMTVDVDPISTFF